MAARLAGPAVVLFAECAGGAGGKQFQFECVPILLRSTLACGWARCIALYRAIFRAQSRNSAVVKTDGLIYFEGGWPSLPLRDRLLNQSAFDRPSVFEKIGETGMQPSIYHEP